ncbi:DUF1707 SHOCT-like domain-containing protein [Nocardioides iriomotensis]|uniref:DUF1707 and DUF2154 domain-containing protein n=1 Tax=Nocardioides iriomotensis TaxID=715784 RepID=A0A4Q5J906_9ACTN|nr:DUF1707 domain-containing protein [Nocardioides iriomotensis]RYU14205.1 DUF1707 and DUF2154 domain-containing protein [Nocardioides iriomotensis]
MDGQGGLQRRPVGPVGDPSRLRISDDDRHKVAEVLRKAAGEGRIDLEELDERLEATYAAKTYGDLVPITADLPVAGVQHAVAPAPRPQAPQVPATVHESSFSIMGDCTRRGVWQVPAKHNAFTMMGSITLDLREAQFSAQETVIEAYAIMAGVEIVVNPWTQVIVEGVGIMGAFGEARSKVTPDIRPDSPVVRIKGLALMAGVDVKRKDLPGTTRNRLGITNR